MCYANPGPRCSSHAGDKLLRAQMRYIHASKQGDPELIGVAARRLHEAQEEFDSTPTGTVTLKRAWAQARANGDESVADELKARIHQGAQTRREQLRAYHLSGHEARTIESVRRTMRDLGGAATIITDGASGVIEARLAYAGPVTISDARSRFDEVGLDHVAVTSDPPPDQQERVEDPDMWADEARFEKTMDAG